MTTIQWQALPLYAAVAPCSRQVAPSGSSVIKQLLKKKSLQWNAARR